jgi:hypothetical protein
LCGNTSSGLSSLPQVSTSLDSKSWLPVIRAGGTLAHFSLDGNVQMVDSQTSEFALCTLAENMAMRCLLEVLLASVFAFLMHGFVSKLGTTTSIRTSFSTLERQYRGEFLICISLNPNNIW